MVRHLYMQRLQAIDKLYHPQEQDKNTRSGFPDDGPLFFRTDAKERLQQIYRRG